MSKTEYTVRLNQTPFKPPIEQVDGLLLSCHAPCSDEMVTIHINPAVEGYAESEKDPGSGIKIDATAGTEVRQATLTRTTDETQQLEFDFGENSVQRVAASGKEFEIRLLNIGRDAGFLYFEFHITEL